MNADEITTADGAADNAEIIGDAQETRNAVLAALYEVAPELTDEELATDEALRDQADLDSMDWLSFLIGVKRTLGVDIPESDYSHLRTIDDIVNHVARHH